MKRRSKLARLDENLYADFFKAGMTRVDKKLSKCSTREMSMPKISNLATRCPSYKKLLEELTSLPEKKNDK